MELRLSAESKRDRMMLRGSDWYVMRSGRIAEVRADGFDVTTSAAPNLDIIKRLEDIGVTRVSTGLTVSEPDGITRSLEKIANDIIARV